MGGLLSPHPLATYSIVAIDRDAGLMGVAVQSHWFSVGSVVCWAEPGVGVVATQSLVDVSYGPLGLALMRGGFTPQRALKALTAADPRPDVRQVAFLDAEGRVAVHTGENCIPEAGHIEGDGFAVQANLMRSREVWPAMADAFRSTEGPLQYRLMAALEAAEGVGGDIRGRQSAAMLIVRVKSSGRPWEDRILDLRVEDHPEPLKELRRLIEIHEAYTHAHRGDTLTAQGKIQEAMEEYRRAAEKAPQIEELRFWQAVTLLSHGKTDIAIPLFQDVFKKNDGWRQVLRSLPKVRLYQIDQQLLEKILSL
jgi:uncharacterized Ntn-hydrolase superfamily protein